MVNNEKAELIINSIPEKDAYTVLDIIEKTIEVMNIKEQLSQEEFAAFTEQERYSERTTPRIEKFKLNEKLSTIFIRFVGDETPIAEALFYPIEAVWSFLETAREYAREFQPPPTDEQIEKFAFDKAVDMFCIMLRNIYPRMMLAMSSLTDETINEWYRQRQENMTFFYSKDGIQLPKPKVTVRQIRSNILRDYGKEIMKVWENEEKNSLKWQKLRFAEEYEKIYPHWKMLNKICRDFPNWRDYAKTGEFNETPDDLLNKLEDTEPNRLSELALEHAARKINLIKIHNVSETDLELRKNGILVSGYTSTQLFNFLNEGKQISAQMKIANTFEQKGESAQTEDEKSVEQNGLSA